MPHVGLTPYLRRTVTMWNYYSLIRCMLRDQTSAQPLYMFVDKNQFHCSWRLHKVIVTYVLGTAYILLWKGRVSVTTALVLLYDIRYSLCFPCTEKHVLPRSQFGFIANFSSQCSRSPSFSRSSSTSSGPAKVSISTLWGVIQCSSWCQDNTQKKVT